MSTNGSYLGWKVDYTKPRGEPALLHPSSVHWRVYKNPVAIAIGGVAAVLLEFADPRIRSGVWDHSTYKADPIGRSKRTGIAAMVGVYGPQSAARRVIQGVTNMHSRVNGSTPKGEAYRALDPDLLDWVSATAGYGFLTAYDRFVEPVTPADKTRFYREGATVARLYGVQHSPASSEDFHAMMEAMLPRFERHPIIEEFLEIIKSGRAAPGVPKFLHQTLARAAVSILPAVIRERLRLGPHYDLTLTDRFMLKIVAGLANRFAPADAPCRQAAQRLGLPSDFLYRTADDQDKLLREAGLDEVMIAAAA